VLDRYAYYFGCRRIGPEMADPPGLVAPDPHGTWIDWCA